MTSENLTPEHATKRMQENIGDPEIVKQMILQGADVNEPIYSSEYGDKYSPLELCLEDGHYKSAELLIRDNKTKISDYAISCSVTRWCPELLKLMVEEHKEASKLISKHDSLLPVLLGSINDRDLDSLFGPNREAQSQLFTLLLDNGAKVNGADSRGDTILHNAVEFRALYLCKKLLQKSDEIGLDIAATNQDGETAFHKIAFLLNNSETLDMYRQRRNEAMFQCVNSDIESDKESLDYLMQKLHNEGVDINQKNKAGDTALHKAIQEGLVDKDTLVSMVRAGANISIKNNSQITPLDMLVGPKAQWRADLTRAYKPEKREHPRIKGHQGRISGKEI